METENRMVVARGGGGGNGGDVGQGTQVFSCTKDPEELVDNTVTVVGNSASCTETLPRVEHEPPRHHTRQHNI